MVTATLITVTVAVLVSGTVFWVTAPKSELPLLGLCAALTAPMCWIMLHLVREPLDTALQSFAYAHVSLPWLRTARAPLTEGSANLRPLLMPSARHRAEKGICRVTCLALLVYPA